MRSLAASPLNLPEQAIMVAGSLKGMGQADLALVLHSSRQ